ncbi:Alpha/Beta hydrolase protein [Plectosphaerella cucumerina]|uniref:Alpha/Beta hydrolase protein n=1 Tax=Plectosphaerella cucumerina TaxID=40658 RepID=A0A8K0TBK2_9PEZI|nr:Alpha/Beta hydrolase protein [Plectosphaerella cucumerina]
MLFNVPFLSLLALASAVPLADFSRALNNLDARAISATQTDLDNFRFFVQYASAAYCNSENAPGAPVVCAASACKTVEANRAVTVASVEGPKSGLGALVAVDHVRRAIVLTVRGSANVRNWLTNLQFTFSSCSDLVANCKVHNGFGDAWAEIRPTVLDAVRASRAANPTYSVITTGHSLGGAVATIAAAYLRRVENIPVDIYSFGSPRVGNDHFANFVTAQAGAEFRLTHGADPVSRLPPILFGYRHTSPEYWLNGGSSSTVDHALNNLRVCEGIANIGCNGGTLGLDIDAHGYYLADVSACNPKNSPTARQADISDAELEQRLNAWVHQDVEWVEEHTA